MAPTQQTAGDRVSSWAPAGRQLDERLARASLRAQIARLERELAAVVADTFPHVSPPEPWAASAADMPRLLSLGELERERDELAERVRRARVQAQRRAALVERSRALLEEMRRDPRRHKFMRVKVADLGGGACGTWEVRPRLGILGMLAGWWEVKLSSGCP